MEEELNAGLKNVKLSNGSKTKMEPESEESAPSMFSPSRSDDSSDSSSEDSSPRLVDTPPHR